MVGLVEYTVSLVYRSFQTVMVCMRQTKHIDAINILLQQSSSATPTTTIDSHRDGLLEQVTGLEQEAHKICTSKFVLSLPTGGLIDDQANICSMRSLSAYPRNCDVKVRLCAGHLRTYVTEVQGCTIFLRRQPGVPSRIGEVLLEEPFDRTVPALELIRISTPFTYDLDGPKSTG